MSRSHRKPYCAVTGMRSAAHDKLVARRCWRRAQNQAIRSFKGDDWLDLIVPIRHEASFNNTYCWGRDGRQSLQRPPVFNQEVSFWLRDGRTEEQAYETALYWFDRDMRWYEKLKRK